MEAREREARRERIMMQGGGTRDLLSSPSLLTTIACSWDMRVMKEEEGVVEMVVRLEWSRINAFVIMGTRLEGLNLKGKTGLFNHKSIKE